MPQVARADKNWKTSVANGNWNVASNWVEGAVPSGNSEIVAINGFNDANDHTIIYDGNYLATDSALFLGNDGGGTTILSMSTGNNLGSGYAMVGGSGRGRIVHSSGSHTVTRYLTLAAGATGTGTYELSGSGTLTLNATVGSTFGLLIGEYGTGLFTQSGGSVSVSGSGNHISVGYTAGSSGTYNLSGSGTLQTPLLYVGDRGTAFYSQTGGTASVTGAGFIVAAIPGSTGTATFSGGTFTTTQAYIGGNTLASGGAGALNIQSGGSVTVTGTLKVWNTTDTQVNLSGGTLTVGALDTSGNPSRFLGDQTTTGWTGGTLRITNDNLAIQSAGVLGNSLTLQADKQLIVSGTARTFAVGDTGTGTVTHNGGSVACTSPFFGTGLFVGNAAGSNGTYNFYSGTINVTASEYIGYAGQGVFNQFGGNNSTADLRLGVDTTGVGIYNLSGGTLASTFSLLVGHFGSATFTHSGGIHTAGGPFYLGVAAGGSGTYTINEASASFTVNNNAYVGGDAAAGGVGRFDISDGSVTIAQTLKVWNTGAAAPAGTGVNLTGGTLVVGALDLSTPGATARFVLDGGTLKTDGNITAAPGETFVMSGASTLTSKTSGGVATFRGASASDASTFDFAGGTVAGNALRLSDANLRLSGGTAGTFTFVTDGNLRIGGSETAVPPAVTVVAQGSPAAPSGVTIYADGNTLINDGTIRLTSSGGVGSAGLVVNTAGAYGFFINAGIVDIDAGSGGSRTVDGLLINSGTVNVDADLTVTGESNTQQFVNNSGALNVAAGKTISLGAAGQYFDQVGGDLHSDGGAIHFTASGGGTFTYAGGTVTGTGLRLYNATVDFAGGAGGNLVFRSGGAVNVSDGSDAIPGGTTITAEGNADSPGGFTVSLPVDLVNRGTLAVHSIGGAFPVAMTAPPGGTLVNNGLIDVSAGTLNAGGHLAVGGGAFDSGAVTLTGGGTLVVTGSETIGVSGTGTFNQAGGTHDVGGVLTLAASAGSSAAYQLSGGTLTAPNLVVKSNGAFTYGGAATLNIPSITLSGGGALTVAQGANKLVKLTALTVDAAGGARLDLADNKLVLTTGSAGIWNGSDYTGISGLVRSARNGGLWTGGGIATSMTDAVGSSALTTLAVATAADVGYGGTRTFGGASVSASDVLVMYTWAGDANLTGAIDGDDFFRIDAGYTGALTGYANGDFNYSGNIDADDYFIIDRNYARQGPAIDSAVTPGVAVVPEPTAIYLVAASLAALARRRRQRA